MFIKHICTLTLFLICNVYATTESSSTHQHTILKVAAVSTHAAITQMIEKVNQAYRASEEDYERLRLATERLHAVTAETLSFIEACANAFPEPRPDTPLRDAIILIAIISVACGSCRVYTWFQRPRIVRRPPEKKLMFAEISFLSSFAG